MGYVTNIWPDILPIFVRRKDCNALLDIPSFVFYAPPGFGIVYSPVREAFERLSTPQQRDQIGVLLHFALNEIPLRIGREQHSAASELAYACHNLPSFNPAHFERSYFRRWFTRFHALHGELLYNVPHGT
jgi:hypothetical protein